MARSLFDHDAPHPEASRLVAFAGSVLDRRSEHRKETDLADAFANGAARVFALAGDRLVMKVDGARLEGLFSPAEVEALGPDRANALLLGWAPDGAPVLAIPVDKPVEELPDGLKALDPRSIYRQQLLDPETLGAYALASSLNAWSRSNRFCGRCGGALVSEAGGYRRRCAACDALVFPRTDPVAIMLVIDEAGDRCLLGRNASFPNAMYSCLAGFIEPGETIEDAVRRETMEESGIRVGRVRYHASQPWPMPHTLMIGAFGEAKSLEINADTTELEDCRWFTRAETQAMLETALGENAATPPPGAIAHRLMRDWLDWTR